MKVEFKYPRGFGDKAFHAGVHEEMDDAYANGDHPHNWFFKALEEKGDLRVLEGPKASVADSVKDEEVRDPSESFAGFSAEEDDKRGKKKGR